MAEEIILKIIITIVGVITTGACGYLSAKVKNYHTRLDLKEKNEKIQNEALKNILQSQLTNVYYVYQEIGEIPDYVYRNWLNMLAIYEALGGDDYIHTLADKMKTWKIKKTDILK